MAASLLRRLCRKQLETETIYSTLRGNMRVLFCLLCHSWAWHIMGETCCCGVLTTTGFFGGSVQAELEPSELAAKAAEGAAMLGLNTGRQLAL